MVSYNIFRLFFFLPQISPIPLQLDLGKWPDGGSILTLGPVTWITSADSGRRSGTEGYRLQFGWSETFLHLHRHRVHVTLTNTTRQLVLLLLTNTNDIETTSPVQPLTHIKLIKESSIDE